jgi:phenylpyruvate tautomerase PptA (4-oxalocrotonate tautomerase family)
MPVYTIFHRSYISSGNRRNIAEELTKLHTNVTGAEPQAVKVMFFELDTHNIFIGGESAHKYVRVVGQIRQGRTEAQKTDLLEGMHKIMRAVVPKGEIQVQIQEIDDTKTVMTNGVMNT